MCQPLYVLTELKILTLTEIFISYIKCSSVTYIKVIWDNNATRFSIKA